jgi:hypothetical protein
VKTDETGHYVGKTEPLAPMLLAHRLSRWTGKGEACKMPIVVAGAQTTRRKAASNAFAIGNQAKAFP